MTPEKKAVREAIEAWLPNRRKTIKQLEEVAKKIKNCCSEANYIEDGGCSVVSAACAIPAGESSTTKVAKIVSVASVEARKAFKKASKTSDLSKLIEEAQSIINAEGNEYKAVIDNLKLICQPITDKSKLKASQPEVENHVIKAIIKIAVGLVTVFLAYLAGSAAAARADSTSTRESLKAAAFEALEKEQSLQIICGSALTVIIVEAVATAILEKKIASGVVGAAAAAVSAFIIKVSEETAFTLLEHVDGETAARVLPILNFEYAALGIGEVVIQSVIEKESKEEKAVREKIKDLKNETKIIVCDIYNTLT